MFTNVLDNAIKYSRENGKVGVYVTESDEKISVTIADDGIGMDEETKRRMFDKYFRADKSRNTRGNGLGLATVKKIAELLELKIKVDSKTDKGTKVTGFKYISLVHDCIKWYCCLGLRGKSRRNTVYRYCPFTVYDSPVVKDPLDNAQTA